MKTLRHETTQARFATERARLHRELMSRHVLSVDDKGIPSLADKGSRLSVAVATGIVAQLPCISTPIDRSAGPTAGSRFEEIFCDFLRRTFLKLEHLRPGTWQILDLDQTLGTDYLITPGVTISRAPEPDEVINRNEVLVSDGVAYRTALRACGGLAPFVHASISTKWTLPSGWEPLIRNRKGRVPHVVVVTAEPLPSRIASLALGTGDIDCLYHVFLDEVVKVVRAMAKDGVAEESNELLNTMIDGHRLRDISDLPLDLAV